MSGAEQPDIVLLTAMAGELEDFRSWAELFEYIGRYVKASGKSRISK